MRTTIRLDDALLASAKAAAAESGQTLTQLISDALRESLARRARTGAGRKRIRLTTFKGNGTLPGVDLTNSAGLADLMDQL